MSREDGTVSPRDGESGVTPVDPAVDGEDSLADPVDSPLVEPTKTRHSALRTVDPDKSRHSALGLPDDGQ